VLLLLHARGCPFRAVRIGRGVGVPQLPTTLPTLDELIGRLPGRFGSVDHLLALTGADDEARITCFTLTRNWKAAPILNR